MTIFLAADHRGFNFKEKIKSFLTEYTVVDVGAPTYLPDDDYVDYGVKAVEQMHPEDRAILLCGSGHGMDMTANRFYRARAILGFNPEVVKQGREHEDANVLIIPADWTDEKQLETLVNLFLSTPFSGAARHKRRIEKLETLT